MTEYDYGNPEELLLGADRPRPLPPSLRARLEATLVGAAVARPLPPGTRNKLEGRLLPASRGTGSRDAATGPGVATALRKRWTLVPLIGVAAALVALAAVGVPRLLQGGGSTRVVAGHKVPGPQSLYRLGPARTTRAGVPASAPPRPSGSSGPPATAGPSTTAGPSRSPGPSRSSGPPASTRSSGPSTPQKSWAPTKLANPSVSPVGAGAANAAAGPPTVLTVSPRSGPAAGGNWVRVSGSSFRSATLVRFGTIGDAEFRVVSAGVIEVMAPRHEPGAVDVAVVSPVGTSRVSPADRYSFRS